MYKIRSPELRTAVLIFLVIVLVSCSPKPTPPPVTATSVVTDTPVVVPTDTMPPPPPPSPTPTLTVVPTETETPLPSETPTVTPTEIPPATPTKLAFKDAIWVYYIATKEGGSGCSDEAVPFSIGVKRSGNIEQDVREALYRLITYHNSTFGDYQNPIGNSNFAVNSVKFDRSIGNLIVEMTGDYKPPKKGCEASHVKQQVFQTARQFKEVKGTDITLNGVAFGDVLARDQK